MSERQTPPRPRQVTMAGVVGAVASVLLVFSLFDSLTRIRSIEMREAIEEFLATPPGDGLGLTPERVIELLRLTVLFNGALAAAAAVLALYVVQRHHASRILFSVVAVLLLLTSPVTGGALAVLVAFAASLLWGRPARDWFAGREPQPVTSGRSPGPSENRRSAPAAWPPPSSSSSHQPPQVPASGPPAGQPTGQDGPRPAAYPFGEPPGEHAAAGHGATATAVHERRPPQAWAPPLPAVPPRRPRTVTAAVALTLVFSGVTALGLVLVVAGLMTAQDQLLAATSESSDLAELALSERDVLSALWVTAAVGLFWCLAAMVLALLVARRSGAARFGLVFSALMAVVFLVVALPVTLAHLVAAVATVVLLFTGGAGEWFAGRSGGPGASGGSPAYGVPSAEPGPPPPQPPVRRKPPVW